MTLTGKSSEDFAIYHEMGGHCLIRVTLTTAISLEDFGML